MPSPPSDQSDIVDVNDDETTPMDVLNPNLEDDSEDVEMEDHQDEVISLEVRSGDSTVAQDRPAVVDTTHPSATDRPVTSTPSLVEQFHDSGFIYIFIKHYDTERQKLTGLCGIAAKKNGTVKEAVQKSLPGLALPKVSDASTIAIWKEVGLDSAKLIEPYSTFQDENLTSGSIIILQSQPSAEE